MKRLILLTVLMALAAPAAFAVPTLQLYIDGATYDNVTQTWITEANSFELYVIGKGDMTNVTLSMALEGVGEFDDPSGSAVDIDGTGFPAASWTYGYAPLSADPEFHDGGDDLAPHGIYPAWFTEFGLGSFTNQGGIRDVTQSNVWNPADDGYDANSKTQGWFQSYTVNVTGGKSVHFDAYTLNTDGTIDQFAPFSHDAQGGVPEPATMLLFGMGLAGTGLVRRFKKK